jgi:uncharacterized membrane protein
MTYNLHPVFVHFPIALLLLYSFIKVVPFKKWFPSISWRQIEQVLLTAGIFGAFAALATGETAEHLVKPNHDLVEMHARFALWATLTYGVLFLGELSSILNINFIPKLNINFLTKISNKLEKIFTNDTFSKVLAVYGFFDISVTGILGGVMVYGLSADPLAPLLLNLLGINL